MGILRVADPFVKVFELRPSQNDGKAQKVLCSRLWLCELAGSDPEGLFGKQLRMDQTDLSKARMCRIACSA